MIRDERGFTLLEVIIVVTILSVLAMVAVPRFNNAVALANTAKIQTDLQTLDSSIAMYFAENGSYPASLSDLKDYVTDVDKLKPPTGKCVFSEGNIGDIPAAVYTIIDDSTSGKRAACGGKTVYDFGKK